MSSAPPAPDRRVVLTSARLDLLELAHEDADFLVDLLNQPSFLRYIGDRGAPDRAGARRYVDNGPGASYRRNGFGLYLVRERATGAKLGLCGLVRRDTLPDVDIGFAFLPQYWSQGYAFEAASATLAQARDVLGLRRVIAITSPDNDASGRLLGRLGFRYERMLRLANDANEVRCYGLAFD